MSKKDSPERWDRIAEVFARALEVSAEDRDAFLRDTCEGDEALEEAVRELLDSDREAEGVAFLDPPPALAGIEDRRPLLFGDYEIGEHLGSGAFGKVYQARQISLNRRVALKLIRLGDLADPDDIRRFRLEAETVAAMDHPNIVPLFEVGEHDGQHYFSMKLMPGGNLASHKEAYRDRPDAAALLVAEVADGVDHAHRRGVLHRDLKPANILMDEAGRPIVTDFGLARRHGTQGSTQGGAIGTPAYMSPEQVRGRREAITTATDIYGLGAVLYELLTGRPPFQAEGDFDMLRQVVEEDPTPPRHLVPGISRDLDAICLRCLDKDPERRYSSAADLATDLRSAARGEPVTARSPGLRSRARRLIRTRPRLVVAILILAVVVPTAGVMGWLIRRDEAARRQRIQLEVEALARDASLDMEQGRWSSAVERLGRAIAAGHRQPARLRIEQARALFVLNRKEVANALESAKRGQDADQVEGDRLLWEGDLLMGRDTPKAVESIRRALQVGISKRSDRIYAEGLLARDMTEARRLFSRALDDEKFHPRATPMLVLTELLIGDRPAARGRLAVARGVFAEDPGLAIIEASLVALDGDVTKAVARLREATNLENRANAELFVRALDGLNRNTDLLAPDPRAIQRYVVAFTRPMLGGLSETGLVVPAAFQEGLTDALTQIAAPSVFSFLRTTDRLAELAKSYRDHPDGMIQFTVGMQLFGAQRIAEAEGFLLRAADRPALIRLERPALYTALNCQGWMMRRDPSRTPESIAAAGERAGRTAVRLWQTGPLPEAWCSTFAYSARLAKQTDLAEAAAEHWASLGGQPVEVEALRAQIHFAAGRYARAIERARAVLRLKPGDAAAVDVLARSRALLDEERKRVDAPG